MTNPEKVQLFVLNSSMMLTIQDRVGFINQCPLCKCGRANVAVLKKSVNIYTKKDIFGTEVGSVSFHFHFYVRRALFESLKLPFNSMSCI